MRRCAKTDILTWNGEHKFQVEKKNYSPRKKKREIYSKKKLIDNRKKNKPNKLSLVLIWLEKTTLVITTDTHCNKNS